MINNKGMSQINANQSIEEAGCSIVIQNSEKRVKVLPVDPGSQASVACFLFSHHAKRKMPISAATRRIPVYRS